MSSSARKAHYFFPLNFASGLAPPPFARANTLHTHAHARTDDLKACVLAFEDFDVQKTVHTEGTGAACPPYMDHVAFHDALQEAAQLRLSTRLSAEGTKTVHAHIGQLLALRNMGEARQAGAVFFSVRLPQIKILLEEGQAEVLFLSVTDVNVQVQRAYARARSDASAVQSSCWC